MMQGRLMGPPNATWGDIIGQASAQPDILRQPEVVRNIQNILQTNVSVCSSLGQPFVTQMSHIYDATLNVYRYGAWVPLILASLIRSSCVIISQRHHLTASSPRNSQHRVLTRTEQQLV